MKNTERPSHQYLHIEDILYDRDNPREYLYWLEVQCSRGKISKKEFDDQRFHWFALSNEDTAGEGYQRVQDAIVNVGFIIHPIIVVRIKKNKYICVEGNTRLSIYKNLSDQAKAESDENSTKWDTIPAIVFTKLSDEVVHLIRRVSHFRTGRSWTPASRAKYISDHLNKDNESDLSKQTGFGISELWDYKKAWELYEKYIIQEAKKNSDKPIFDNFSIWEEVAKKGDIQQTVVRNGGYLALAKWIREKRFKRAEHVRQLPLIEKNKIAWSLFLKQDTKAALDFLGLKNDESLNFLEQIDLFENRLIKWKGGYDFRSGHFGEHINGRLRSLVATISALFSTKAGKLRKQARKRK
jgi:hypothetical protein